MKVRRPPLVKCPWCGLYRPPGAWPHAPRLRVVDGVWRVVDCAGRVLPEYQVKPESLRVPVDDDAEW